MSMVESGSWKLLTKESHTLNSYGGKMKRLVQPSNSFRIPSGPAAVSVARSTVAPMAQTRLPLAFDSLTSRHASSSTNICSESHLCLVRSSTSIWRKLPRPMWRVMNAWLMPTISMRFISSREKWSPVTGAVTAPSFDAKMVWKFSRSSGTAWRMWRTSSGIGASPSA